jgi:CIC family chloride channel protein
VSRLPEVNEDSLMTEKLRRRGLRIGRHYGVDPFTHARVADIMTAEVDTIAANATVGAARSSFAGSGHGAYPIVDGDGRIIGIIARGDILRDDCPDDHQLVDHATRDVVTVRPGDPTQTALRVMIDEHVEHVPVVDGNQRLVGICTRTDLLKVRRRQLDLERVQAGVARRRRNGRRPSAPAEQEVTP